MSKKKAKPSDTFGRIRIAKCCANCKFFEEEGTMDYAWWCGLEGFETFHAESDPHLFVCKLFQKNRNLHNKSLNPTDCDGPISES